MPNDRIDRRGFLQKTATATGALAALSTESGRVAAQEPGQLYGPPLKDHDNDSVGGPYGADIEYGYSQTVAVYNGGATTPPSEDNVVSAPDAQSRRTINILVSSSAVCTYDEDVQKDNPLAEPPADIEEVSQEFVLERPSPDLPEMSTSGSSIPDEVPEVDDYRDDAAWIGDHRPHGDHTPVKEAVENSAEVTEGAIEGLVSGTAGAAVSAIAGGGPAGLVASLGFGTLVSAFSAIQGGNNGSDQRREIIDRWNYYDEQTGSSPFSGQQVVSTYRRYSFNLRKPVEITVASTFTPGEATPTTIKQSVVLSNGDCNYRTEGQSCDIEFGGSDSPGQIDGNQPTDPDSDGLYEDLNGNGEVDYDDVVTYFDNMESDAMQNDAEYYDYNGNGGVDYADLVELFNMI